MWIVDRLPAKKDVRTGKRASLTSTVSQDQPAWKENVTAATTALKMAGRLTLIAGTNVRCHALLTRIV